MNRLPFFLTLILLASPAFADPAAPLTSLARMPVREVTVFKDGHALVLHTGKMPTDASGNVVIDALPNPVLGTFWPFSAEKDAKLASVVASVRKVKLERTALTLRELIEANVGQQVNITEAPIGAGTDARPITYAAIIESVPVQSGEEIESTSPPNTGDHLSNKGALVMLRTPSGVKAVNIDRIVDLTFAKPPRTLCAQEEFRNLLTLHLDWANKPAAREAEVGMLYLQKGIRWIPNYKVTIDGKGKAVVKLQATLINELTDLEDATVHLVIGVPSFAFASSNDPIGLQQAAAQLSQYFQSSQDTNSNRITSNAFNNGIMTQVQIARPVRGGAAPVAAPNLGPDMGDGNKAEDLFLFTLQRITLKKGQRMTLTVGEQPTTYKDLYVLDIPVAPPPEVFRSFDDSRKADIARALASPKVMHKIRLANTSSAPMTTAPALIVQNDRVIAQGMMTYTPAGAPVDLDLTAAVDVQVRKSEQETARTPRAEKWNGDDYMRIDCSGKITLTSFAKDKIEVEVVRHFLGNFGSADRDGKSRMLNHLEDSSYMPTSRAASSSLPYWHSWYSWPWWWHRFNSVGEVTWTLTLDPTKPVELNYSWHYFWR